MILSIRWFSNAVVLLATIPGVTPLGGCVWLDVERALERSEQWKYEDQAVVQKIELVSVEEYANKFALAALFAKVTYRIDLPQHERTALGCAYLTGGDLPDFGMPMHG